MSLASLFAIAPSGGSFTVRFLGLPLVVALVVAGLATRARLRRTRNAALASALVLATMWIGLYVWRPRWVDLALADPRGAPAIGDVTWVARAAGLETAELDIALAGHHVDTIALVRLDPAHYELSVHWDQDASRTATAWQRELDVAVVINGSYYEPDHAPSTPLRIAGVTIGPMPYTSSHGALVIDEGRADIIDLAGRDVGAELRRHHEAMVSYPLLVDPAGGSRAAGNDDWFANRVFVGVDTAGRIVIGTTRTGFCSLRRLGDILVRARLHLRAALNLDGGPLASQVVRVPGYARTVLGDAEITGGHDVLRLAYQALRRRSGDAATLPIVLAARRVRR